MLDGASNITQGISGTATSLMSKPRITRLRRPRLLYSPDRILVIYREEEAFVKHLMENVESTKIDTKIYFCTTEYVTHVALPRARLMLVTRHLVSVWSCQTFLDGLDQSPNVSWIASLSHIKDLHIANNGKAVAIICMPKEVKEVSIKARNVVTTFDTINAGRNNGGCATKTSHNNKSIERLVSCNCILSIRA